MIFRKINFVTGCLLSFATVAMAFNDSPLDFIRDQQKARAPDAPKLDPKRIINSSLNFLKDREPEMTAEEYALYEKVVTTLSANPEFALKLLEAMMNDKEPPSPAFEFILGDVYYSAGQTAQAEARYLSAVKRMPTFLRAWTNLGILYYSTDKYPEAAPCFSKAITLGDHDAATFGLLGFCLEHDGNAVGAEMAYMQALSANPDSTEWMEGLLRVYVQGKQYGRAESLVTTLIKLQPSRAELWLTHVNSLLAQGRKLDATILLEAAAGAGVAGADGLNLLGDLYADQQFNAEAAGVYEKILSKNPEVGERKLLHFAQVLISAHRLPEAEKILDRLKDSVAPERRNGYLQARADLLAARKQWVEARGVLEELLKSAPLDGRALLGLGRAYAAEDNLARAAFAFESAYEVPESTYRASLELANIAFKNHDYDNCIKYLQKALSLEKSDVVADYLARVKTLAAKSG
jgi:tetratricopeptide (TPR) repeat protein